MATDLESRLELMQLEVEVVHVIVHLQLPKWLIKVRDHHGPIGRYVTHPLERQATRLSLVLLRAELKAALEFKFRRSDQSGPRAAAV